MLVTFSPDQSSRDMEAWPLATDAVCAVLALRRVPAHRTLSRARKRLRRRDLDAMRRALRARLPVAEDVIALDSTGSRRTQANAGHQSRRGTTVRSWAEGVSAVGAAWQLILAWRQTHAAAGCAVALARMTWCRPWVMNTSTYRVLNVSVYTVHRSAARIARGARARPARVPYPAIWPSRGSWPPGRGARRRR
jgi:hypothetical protein